MSGGSGGDPADKNGQPWWEGSSSLLASRARVRCSPCACRAARTPTNPKAQSVLPVGLFAGFVRWADAILMRVMDGLMSIPPILLAVALMALTRGSVGDVIVAITIAEIPRVSRLVRSVVLVAARPTFLSVTVLAVNLLGDRLRDALDPRTANGL
jgi:hypothetical protein